MAQKRVHVYVTDERASTFEKIKGKLVRLPKVDPNGTPYDHVMRIPDSLPEFLRQLFDQIMLEMEALK